MTTVIFRSWRDKGLENMLEEDVQQYKEELVEKFEEQNVTLEFDQMIQPHKNNFSTINNPQEMQG